MSSSLDFDPYEALEVTKDASAQDIIASYRRLARLHHPDKNLDNADATAKFQKVQAAYEILSDEHQRREYDQPVQSSPFSGASSRGHRQGFNEHEDGDEFRGIFFDLFFGNLFAQGFSRPDPFQYARSQAEMERRERERQERDARKREEENAREEREKAAQLEKAQRESDAKAKKAMEDAAAAAAAARKEQTEMQSRLKMENIFAANGCVTDVEKQACCEHCYFWPKKQMKRKFKCLNCGQKRGMTQYKCPYCALVLCQYCISTKQFTKTT
ncbi:U2-type spliceosomal complex subunit cwc23 [Ciborinia camelliae]|nr:U2-type spliceosomal complex subunit cwc23 [Ciborinia camelliae]